MFSGIDEETNPSKSGLMSNANFPRRSSRLCILYDRKLSHVSAEALQYLIASKLVSWGRAVLGLLLCIRKTYTKMDQIRFFFRDQNYERRPSYVFSVFSSHPFWTSSSLDVPAGVTQEEGHTGFLIHLPSAVRALIFVARRIQPFLSLVDREVEFCVLTN